MMRHATVSTSLGWVALARSERGIRAVTLPAASEREALRELRLALPDIGEGMTPEEGSVIRAQLAAAIEGGDSLGLPLDLEGTPFQQDVWRVVAH